MKVFQYLKRQNYRFATFNHPSALVTDDVQLGKGVQIMAGAIVQTGCAIGDNVILDIGAILDHDCIIGVHSHIAAGVVLYGGDNGKDYF